MATLIGSEVGLALPTTALFDYPSAESLAYFIASSQASHWLGSSMYQRLPRSCNPGPASCQMLCWHVSSAVAGP